MAKSYVTKVEKSIKEESDKILLARKAISKKAVDLENMEIAQEAQMLPIKEVAQTIGLDEDDLCYTASIKPRSQWKLFRNFKAVKMVSLF